MIDKVITSGEEELYNRIVGMLCNGDFIQLNGKVINLTELNDYINTQQEEIERLKSIIKEVREKIENTTINCDGVADDLIDDIYEILDKEKINETKRF